MSRIGLKPIEIPQGVEVKIGDNNHVEVKGPKGELTRNLHTDINIKVEENQVLVERKNDQKQQRSLHGTTRSLLSNMIEGVHAGYEKHLEIIGVGYRAQMQGTKLVVGAGYSHPVEFEQEEGITIEVPKNTEIIVKGIDKERVGAVAANIRAVRPPEPYKGKGIRYKCEHVRRKEGKTAK